MAFLNFMKKEVPTDIDLDMPPEPPKMMGEEGLIEEPIDEELMPLKKKLKKGPKAKKKKLPKLPPLPKMEGEMPPLSEEKELGELPELPPLPEEKERELSAIPKEGELPGFPPLPEEKKIRPLPKEMPGELELPLPPRIDTTSISSKPKKRLFSFLKRKKAKELELPKIGEEIPPLSEEKGLGELPELPPLPEGEREFKHLPEEITSAAEPLPVEKPVPEWAEPAEHVTPPIKPLPIEKPMPKVEEEIEKPVKNKGFITINDFRQIQEDISGVRGILKRIDGLARLEGEGILSKEHTALRNSLKDIQRHIMFVDKTLFK